MNRKLSLHPDALRVDSFETSETKDARGTVDGNEATGAGCTKFPQCPATQCTCGIDPATLADRDAPTHCHCCV